MQELASNTASDRTQGFSNAQIDRIVERAGVARGTFYFHFPTKEHVLVEAFLDGVRWYRRLLEELPG